MKRKFLPILILLFSISSVMAQVNITFEVNTAALGTVDPTGLFIGGGTGFGGPSDNPLTDVDGDGIWTATFTQPEGFSSHYTFINGDSGWGAKENIAGLPCADPANFNDRFLPGVFSDTTILACFGTCDIDGTCTIVTDSVDITFQLNTANITPDATGMFVGGGASFGGPSDNIMADPDGDGIYTITLTRPKGTASHYTFINGDSGWGAKENIGGLPCADPNNFNDRWLPSVMSDTTILACFGNCADDGTCVQVLAPTLPMDFEATDIDYAPIGFGDATSAIVANPNMDADNGSATVWNVTKVVGGQTWAGASIDLGAPMDFSSTSTIKIKFYSDFAGIPVQVKIENADPAISAEVIVNSTVDAGWETMVFDMSTSTIGTFDPAIDYTKFVVFPDFGNTPFIGDIPFYFDDAELDILAVDNPTLPITFEDPTILYFNGGFGDLSSSVIANPDASGDNTSATVLSLEKTMGAQTWAGSYMPLQSGIDWSQGTTISVKVWSPTAGTPFLLKIENIADPANIAAEVLATSVGANAWETITFDMPSSTVGTFDPASIYDQVVIFPNFGNDGTGATYYADDFAQVAPQEVLPTLPITFESPTITYTAAGFGNLNPSVIANPDASGDNTSATVVALEKTTGAEVWAGASMPLESAIDWSNGTTLSVKVWSPTAGTPFLLKIEDLADPANISAEVLATSVGANAWETITFDMTTSAVGVFDPANNYDQVIIFPNFGNVGTGTTYYADDFDHYSAPIVLPTLPVTFEDAAITYTNNGFGNANSSVIANPDATGQNTSATVLSLEKTAGAEVWAGTSMPLQSAIDWSLQAGNVLSVKVWSPRADVPVLLKIENAASAGAVFAEVQKNTTTANAWETLVFNMASHPDFDAGVDYDLFAVFADFGNAGAGETFYFDDIMNDVDVAISELDKAKVVVTAFPNPADQVVNINFSIPVSGNITFTMVDLLGRNVQEVNEGNLYEGNYQTVIDVNGLNSGVYFLVTRLDGEIISTKNIMKK